MYIYYKVTLYPPLQHRVTRSLVSDLRLTLPTHMHLENCKFAISGQVKAVSSEERRRGQVPELAQQHALNLSNLQILF